MCLYSHRRAFRNVSIKKSSLALLRLGAKKLCLQLYVRVGIAKKRKLQVHLRALQGRPTGVNTTREWCECTPNACCFSIYMVSRHMQEAHLLYRSLVYIDIGCGATVLSTGGASDGDAQTYLFRGV